MKPSADAARIYIIVPAFNEARAIRAVVDGVTAIYPNVVVVDDGSTDGTSASLAGSGVFLLRHRLNRGQGAALATGIRYALGRGAEVVVTFDSDGQHDAAEIERLARPVLDGECDVALGSRFLGRTIDMPLSRRVLLKFAVLFTRLLSRVRVTDAHNGLRAFSARAAGELEISMDRMAHASEILDQLRRQGWRYKEVPVTVRYTSYSLNKGQTVRDALRIGAQVLLDKLRR